MKFAVYRQVHGEQVQTGNFGHRFRQQKCTHRKLTWLVHAMGLLLAVRGRCCRLFPRGRVSLVFDVKPPAFQFYVDNFIEGTIEMSDAEVGLYIRLLCAQWNRGGLCSDDRELSRFSRGQTPAQLKRSLARVKLKFEKKSDGLLKNNRMESEREKQVSYREKQAINGAKGGRPENPNKPKPNPSLSENVTQTKAKKSSPSPSPSPVSNKEVIAANAGEHGAFIKGWCENFKSKFLVDYKVDGGRDGKAVKELLSMGILRIDLLEIAKKAWSGDTFNCKQSQTIHGFRNRFNEIHIEVKNGKTSTTHQKPNPRNIGIIIGPTDYGAAKPRAQRLREEAEAAELARQMDANANHSPQGQSGP